MDVDEDVEHGVAHTAALLIQHDIARKMQKLNEGHLQVALHPTLLLFLLLLLLPAAATKIRKRIKRIRENSSTISHLFVSSNSSSSAGSSRGGGWAAWLGGLVGMVHWHKMPIRISSSQSVGPCAAMADAQGVEYSPTSTCSPSPPSSSSSSFASSSPSLR